MYKDNQYAEEKLQQSVPTNGTPVSSHTVILDAGHGEPDRAGQYQKMGFLKKKLIC